MARILGIETSCDETAAAVFDSTTQRLLSNCLHSQTKSHERYGGVVPEVASRSHLIKIDGIVSDALAQAGVTLDDIDTVAVTNRPGLVGSLLVGLCFAKGIAWGRDKNLIGINHLEGHMFSPFLSKDFTVNSHITFPHINLSASGGHSSFYRVDDFGSFEILGTTTDDAAGEAFDKIAKAMGLPYPGGPVIEQLAAEVDFIDFRSYPRTKNLHKDFNFTFSGIKTAVLYDLVKSGAYDMKTGLVPGKMTRELQREVASSLLVCVGDIFEAKVKKAFQEFPEISGFTFAGGVACNQYLRKRLSTLCELNGKWFAAPPPALCVDNGAMIAFVGGYKHEKREFDSLDLDVEKIAFRT